MTSASEDRNPIALRKYKLSPVDRGNGRCQSESLNREVVVVAKCLHAETKVLSEQCDVESLCHWGISEFGCLERH